MKKIAILFLTLGVLSCTITRKINIVQKTEAELIDFYKSKNIDSFLVVKDYAAFKVLSDSNRVTIPQNFIFDANGNEIEHFDDKLCANHTLTFLKDYNPEMKIKLKNYNIASYLENFKSINGDIQKDEILNTKEIRVFVNTATFAEKMKVNKEALEINNLYNGKYKVYVINLDFGTWNKGIN